MTIKKAVVYQLMIGLIIMCGQLAKAQDSLSRFILTPKEKTEPQINCARVFGVRPGHPILFTIATTGLRPLTFTAKALPKGLKLDQQHGRLSGSIDKPGTYTITLTVKNSLGEDKSNLKIVVGEGIALTPPMGWNSYNIYASNLSQDLVVANAKAMANSGLINHGWTYLNIDDAWQGKRGGDFNAIMPDAERFPNMQSLVNLVHALGLKAGIYSTPWVESYGGFNGGSATNPQGNFTRTKEKIPRNRKLLPYAIGSYLFVPNDVKQFTKWGFDYLKYDWNPNEMPETKQMFDALRNSGRDVVLSLSNSTPFNSIAELSRVSNCWRTGDDIRDTWGNLKPRLFSQDKWAPYASPGHWNDPDMMVVGYVGWGHKPRPTLLTADEQYTHMSAWCLMSVPLLLGCDLTKLDAFTLSLLTNDEVIAVNQDVLGRQATVISKQGECGILAKELFNGNKAAGLFNTGDSGIQKVVLSWKDIGIKGKYIVRDLWRQKDLGVFDSEFIADVAVHGVVMVSLRKAN